MFRGDGTHFKTLIEFPQKETKEDRKPNVILVKQNIEVSKKKEDSFPSSAHTVSPVTH